MKRQWVHAFCAVITGTMVLLPVTDMLAQEQEESQQPRRNRIILELEKQIAGRENEPAEKVFKNIQMFKGRPAIQVLRVMENGFAPALGVRCTFCHVRDEWEKDDKPEKQTAREMMKMVGEVRKLLAKIVNEDDAGITCYTCHRGSAEPARSPRDEKREHEHGEHR